MYSNLCTYGGHGECFARNTDNHALRPNDLLCRWKCHVDFDGWHKLSLEPRRSDNASDFGDDFRFLHGPSHQWCRLHCYLSTDGRDGQSTSRNTCDHGIRSDDLLRWRKRDPQQQQPCQQRLDTGRCYHSFDFSDNERYLFSCRQQRRLYFCAFE